MKLSKKIVALGAIATLGLVGSVTTAHASADTSVPMYRVYNPNSGEHFYTKSAYEKSSLVSRGWRYEGIGWNAPTSGSAVYRVYNPNSGEHFYTKSAYEKSVLVSRGWRYEGVEWHTGNSGTPLYRVYNPNSGEHFYTKSAYEKSSLVSHGWRYEGIAWYGVSSQSVQKYQYVGWVSVDGVRKYQKVCNSVKEADAYVNAALNSKEVIDLGYDHEIGYGVYTVDK
ncbi:hypothetical protein JW886_09685 [Lactococcus taiwanensis]|uniref:DUF5648 domain-containing protein n=1 Tax=Lactococcus taiwanensis TaxID=1151742 RepID=A0AA45KG73_9LACT|nr:hypothetical protein [Lactococcus taiwanensis]QSE76702.1 hypothetical protein JW886_09685 [Lactococcus taiwanensis]